MTINLQLKSHVDILSWEDAFRMAGIKRCQPLWSECGIPDPMILAPEGLLECSAYFWETRLGGEIKPVSGEIKTQAELEKYHESYRLSCLALLNNTFSNIVFYYGEEVTVEFYAWVRRHFTEEKHRWFKWPTIFIHLSRKREEGELELSFDKFDLYQLIKLNSEKFLDLEERDPELLKSINAIPLSELEQKMVALEKIEPDDEEQVDLIIGLEILINSEAGYQMIKKIREQASPEELRIFLDEASKISKYLNMGPEVIEIEK